MSPLVLSNHIPHTRKIIRGINKIIRHLFFTMSLMIFHNSRAGFSLPILIANVRVAATPWEHFGCRTEFGSRAVRTIGVRFPCQVLPTPHVDGQKIRRAPPISASLHKKIHTLFESMDRGKDNSVVLETKSLRYSFLTPLQNYDFSTFPPTIGVYFSNITA